MEYIPVVALTLAAFCLILYIVGKFNNVRLRQKSALKQRQSTIHNIVKSLLPTNEEVIQNIIMNRERSKRIKQSKQNYIPQSIRVTVIDNKAYWIQDNTFYETFVTENGEIDQSQAKPVDTTNMEIDEINRLMEIVDDLRKREQNDGGSAGN